MANTRPGVPGHPPYHGGDHTSAWFATQYIHNHIPNISPHDLVRLVASIGQETNGKYTYQSVVHAAGNYSHDGSFPNVGTKWTAHVHDVILAAVHHGRKAWVKGFAYSSKDLPHTGGPSNLQKGAIDITPGLHDIGGAFSSLGGGLGGLLKSPLLILVIIVVIVIVIKK